MSVAPADWHPSWGWPKPEQQKIVLDTRPQCTAESESPDSNHPSHGHLCGLEQGHPEAEHRCPCDEDWAA